MNKPIVVGAASFQDAYLDALAVLRDNHWERWNLAVQATDPTLMVVAQHEQVESLARELGILSPKHVAYTIFPCRLAARTHSPAELRDRYVDRMFPSIRTSWGTYFHRLVAYTGRTGTTENQIGAVVAAINATPDRVYKASFTMTIPYAGGETRRRRGGPCLNYLALQLERNPDPTLNLLAVYRNHDFRAKAYGNYMGLCQLLRYMADQTGYAPGRLTCYSSHAYVDADTNRLSEFLTVNGR